MPRVNRIYAKVDVAMPTKDRMLQVSVASRWAFVCFLAGQKLLDQDGAFTHRQARALLDVQVDDAEACIKELFGAGLIEATPTGYVLPSWSHWNESSEERSQKLAKERARKAQGKQGGASG